MFAYHMGDSCKTWKGHADEQLLLVIRWGRWVGKLDFPAWWSGCGCCGWIQPQRGSCQTVGDSGPAANGPPAKTAVSRETHCAHRYCRPTLVEDRSTVCSGTPGQVREHREAKGLPHLCLIVTWQKLDTSDGGFLGEYCLLILVYVLNGCCSENWKGRPIITLRKN